jgi:hypothetical protein
MTMPFPNIAEGVSLDGMDPGDKVSFSFEVRYENGRMRSYEVVGWEELPAETELDFTRLADLPNADADTDASDTDADTNN